MVKAEESIDMEENGDKSESLLTMETELMTAKVSLRGNNEEIIETKEVNVEPLLTETETRPGQLVRSSGAY